MARPSSIDRLPAEIKQQIGRLRRDGCTIDEILAKLRELEVGISRSALGRHTQQLDAIAAQIGRSRGIAEAVIDRLGDAPEGRQARVNIELMHGLIMRLLGSADGEDATIDPQSAMLVSRALNDLARAHKSDVDRELKLRERVATNAADRAEEVARASGLSAETVAQFRSAILGVASS